MGSYESQVKESASNGKEIDGKLDITLIRYACQSSPLTLNKSDNIPHYFKQVSLLNTFSDRELWQFTKFLHRREFVAEELVFKQGDSGYGFYFIFRGSVNVFTDLGVKAESPYGDLVLVLDRFQYFGEMGLLEEFNRRSASVVAAENTVLLGLFKPDLEEMIERNPVVGAKFLREISLIMSKRMGQISDELLKLKKRVNELEEREQL